MIGLMNSVELLIMSITRIQTSMSPYPSSQSMVTMMTHLGCVNPLARVSANVRLTLARKAI